MYKSVVAQNVKMILKERCLSQGAIANKAGYDGKVFSNMMNNRKIITDVDVANIARALGVTPNKLFGVGEAER